MEELFNNKKELFVGQRIFVCDFSSDVTERKENETDEDEEEEKKKNNRDKNSNEKKEDIENRQEFLIETSNDVCEEQSKPNFIQENENGNIVFEQNKEDSVNDDEKEEEEEEEEEKEKEEGCVDNYLKFYMFHQNVKIKIGTIRYIGILKNHVSNNTYYGIEWDNSFDGKNKGNFKDMFYFYPSYYLKKLRVKMCYQKGGGDFLSFQHSPEKTKETNTEKNQIENTSDEELLKTCAHASPCSFITLQKLSVGITFMQALRFRYNYFPELNLSVTDYQTEKTKKIFFAGEQKVMKHFQNFHLLENITLNKYLIYECGDVKNICFQNLRSLSLSLNLLSKWTDIFKIIGLAKTLSYINLSYNRFMKLNKEDLFQKKTESTKQEPHELSGETTENTNLVFFEQVKELCLDNTMIEWDDIYVLSFIFPNLEILSVKKNYFTSMNIKKWETQDNEIANLYKKHSAYNKIFITNENNEKKNSQVDNIITGTNKKKNQTNIDFFKNLKKIVLNDNYLHSYQELFYFVYKIKSIESIFLNNNKFGDSIKLIEIASEICNSGQISTVEEMKPCERKDTVTENTVIDGEIGKRQKYRINHKEEEKKEEKKEEKEEEKEEECNKEVRKIPTNDIIKEKETETKKKCIVEKVERSSNEIQFQWINQHFCHLKELLFDNNEVKNYETLRDLFYIFYDLEVLKITNKKNYTKEKKSLRYIFIAILPKLKVLNYSSINKNERVNSERFFISLYKRDKVAQIFNEVVLNKRHSALLEKIHYEAQTDDTLEKTNTMKSNLINITIIPEFLDSQRCNIIKKKVNKYMNIKDLKYLCSRLYSISFPKMKLFYTDENSPVSIEILDSNANLHTYGIENNAKIKVQLDD